MLAWPTWGKGPAAWWGILARRRGILAADPARRAGLAVLHGCCTGVARAGSAALVYCTSTWYGEACGGSGNGLTIRWRERERQGLYTRKPRR